MWFFIGFLTVSGIFTIFSILCIMLSLNFTVKKVFPIASVILAVFGCIFAYFPLHFYLSRVIIFISLTLLIIYVLVILFRSIKIINLRKE